jgi:aspartate/methionine/tyrosine aminotransferase
MKIEPFKVEEWMNEYENDAVYNLAETCIDSMTLRELLTLAGEDPEGFLSSLADTRLTYSNIYGSPELLSGISSLYRKIDPEHIVPAHGAIGANHQVYISLISEGDHIVSAVPAYQQHYSIPESIGAEVSLLKLRREDRWLPDPDELRRLARPGTKMIVLTNPNNPTGALVPPDMMSEIVKIAEGSGAYVFCDEVYRGVSEDGGYMPSITDIYEKGISTSSMSKAWSLAGLRLGWVASRDKAVKDAVLKRRDYDTISCGAIDDRLAGLALAHKDRILERNRAIVLKNRKILDEWVTSEPHVSYIPPVAGNTALVDYDSDMPSYDFCKELLKRTGVFFTPGSCFDIEYSFRVGYAFDSRMLAEGLGKTSGFLSGLKIRS